MGHKKSQFKPLKTQKQNVTRGKLISSLRLISLVNVGGRCIDTLTLDNYVDGKM